MALLAKPGIEETGLEMASPMNPNGALGASSGQPGYNDEYLQAMKRRQRLSKLYDPNFKRSADLSDTSKSNQRRGLLSAVADAPSQLRDERELIKSDADTALASGIKNTRQNFNNRGMLYSGLRQGGEQSLRTNVASTMASQVGQANRESGNLVTSQKNALAAIGLKSAQVATAQANATYESNMRSKIARQQAMQQMGQGIGYAAGALYGARDEKKKEDDSEQYQKAFYGTRQYLQPGE